MMTPESILICHFFKLIRHLKPPNAKVEKRKQGISGKNTMAGPNRYLTGGFQALNLTIFGAPTQLREDHDLPISKGIGSDPGAATRELDPERAAIRNMPFLWLGIDDSS